MTDTSTNIDRDNRIRSIAIVLTGLIALTVPAGASEPIHAESVLLRVIDQVDVPANSAGILSNIGVMEGDSVSAGQVLAKIDDFESDLLLERAELELGIAKMQISNDVSVRTAKTEFTFARQSLERIKKAADSLPGSVSDSEVARLQLESLRAELKLEDAHRMLELAKATQLVKGNDVKTMRRKVRIQSIVSPISGTVEHVLHKKGEWLKPGDNVVRVISLRRLRAEGFIRSKDGLQQLKNATVELIVEQHKHRQTFRGKVVFVHSEIDPVNSRLRVWAEVDNSQGHLRPGMRAQMIIHAPPQEKGQP